MKKLLARIAAIPHLFGKIIVWICVLCGAAFSYYSLRILSRTGHDPAALLAVILGFFGGELLLMCLRKSLSDKKSPDERGDE